ncbi:diguanylate cyclase [Thermus thermophilus]|nr:diguanylate cyclase [Thermus thermophilus]
MGCGLYLLRRRENLPWGLGLLLWGLGDLVWALEDLAASPRGFLWESPHLAGYLALTYALWRLPPRPPRLTLGLLPLGLLGLLALLHPELGMDRLYVAWDALLLLLLLPRLEGLFQERFQPGRALLGVGVLLVLVADLAHGYLEAMGGYPTGHPLHLLYPLGYLLLALGVEVQNVPTFPALVLGLGGPEEREALEAWILKADYALLRVKETGRDRVTLA